MKFFKSSSGYVLIDQIASDLSYFNREFIQKQNIFQWSALSRKRNNVFDSRWGVEMLLQNNV